MPRRMSSCIGMVLLLTLLIPGRAAATGLSGPPEGDALYGRIDPAGTTIGWAQSVSAWHLWAAGSLQWKTLGIQAHVGGARQLLTQPGYTLLAWAEAGPDLWLRTPRTPGIQTALGIRNLFGGDWLRGSVGAAINGALAFAEPVRLRYRPQGTAGVGVRFTSQRALPDAIWLRASLGYDFVPRRLGAFHADAWLSCRWSFGASEAAAATPSP